MEQSDKVLDIATGSEIKDALAEARKQVSEANVKALVEVIKIKVAKLDSLKKQAILLMIGCGMVTLMHCVMLLLLDVFHLG